MGRMDEKCSSRKLVQAIRFHCTSSDRTESFVRKCCLVATKTGIKGRTANVSTGLSANIVAMVNPVVRHILRIAGRRSEPK